MLLDEIDIFRCSPDVEHRLLSERGEDEAYLTYRAGEQYAAYFPQGGSVELELEPGEYEQKWLHGEASEWQGSETIRGGGKVELTGPGDGKNWCAVLTTEG